MDKAVLKRLIGFNLILDFIILDQLGKWAVLELFLRPVAAPGTPGNDPVQWLTAIPERLPPAKIEIASFFNLVMVWNEGISFGLFQNGWGGGPVLMIAIALAVTLFFGGWLMKADRWMQAVPLGMVIGGALANVIDRVRFGAVADFLDFHAFGYHWPAFNIADSCITLGIALIVCDGLFWAPEKKETPSP